MNCQNSGAAIGAHGQQFVKATIAVHQVATKDDDALNTVSLAQELGLLS